jgi:phosphate transport system protein
MMSRDLEKRRLLEMVERMYNLVDKLLDTVSESGDISLSEVERLADTAGEYRNTISNQATIFIARFQPLAEDLILAESVISIAYDLYRVARYAREIAMLSNRIGGLKDKVNRDVLEAFETSKSMVREAIEAFIRGERRYVESVSLKDSMVDDVYHRYLDMLRGGDSISVRDVSSLLLARHVERIADHATYIAMSASRLWRIS